MNRFWQIGKNVIVARLAVGAALWIGASPWLSDTDSPTRLSEMPKAVAFWALVALMTIRTLYALRVTATIKKRYTPRDLSQVLAQIGMLAPLVWAVSPVLDFAEYLSNVGMLVVGTLCYVAGIWLCYRSHADLGQGLSPTLDIKVGHRLVTEGIYGRIRHPMYLGLLLFVLGPAFVVSNFVAGPSGLIGMVLLIVLRVGSLGVRGSEEQMMLVEFGDEYAAYRERTARLLPGIW